LLTKVATPLLQFTCHMGSHSRGDIPAFTPAEAGTRFSGPGGMQGWVDLPPLPFFRDHQFRRPRLTPALLSGRLHCQNVTLSYYI